MLIIIMFSLLVQLQLDCLRPMERYVTKYSLRYGCTRTLLWDSFNKLDNKGEGVTLHHTIMQTLLPLATGRDKCCAKQIKQKTPVSTNVGTDQWQQTDLQHFINACCTRQSRGHQNQKTVPSWKTGMTIAANGTMLVH